MAPKSTTKISHQTHTSTVGAVTTSTADPTVIFAKPTLNIQERLQDRAITLWHQPIDEALELHLLGRNTFTKIGNRVTLAQDSWAKWSPKLCKAMRALIPLVSAAQANQLLSAKVAVAYASQDALPDGRYGLQPFMIKEDLADLTGERRTKRESAGGAVQKRFARGRVTRGGGATRGQSTLGGGHGQGIRGGYHGQIGRGAGLGQVTGGADYGQAGGRVGGGYGQTGGRGGRGNANKDERGTLTRFGYRDRDAA